MIKYYSHTLLNEFGRAIPPDGKCVVSEHHPAYLRTYCLGINYPNNKYNASIEFKFDNGECIEIHNPYVDSQEIYDFLATYSDEYLHPEKSYIKESASTIYGFGLYSGSIKKYPIKLSDLNNTHNTEPGARDNDLVINRQMFFNPPVYTRNRKVLEFRTKKLFSRYYTEDVNIPVFVENTLNDLLASKKVDTESCISDGVETIHNKKKFEVTNSCFDKIGNNYFRKWYATSKRTTLDNRELNNVVRLSKA